MVLQDMGRGALAGMAATAPMTLAMVALHRELPWHEQYPLPPSEITTLVIEEGALNTRLPPRAHQALTLANHFAYGAATGALYGPLACAVPLPPVASGVVYGLAVWALSYQGLLPALGILRPATQHPARRTALMIGAHVVWGAALGALTAALADTDKAQTAEDLKIAHQR